MRTVLVVPALVAAILFAAPAMADAPPAGFGPGARGWHGPAVHRPHHPRRLSRHGSFGPRMVAGPGYGAGYGPLPAFFPGTGAAADHLYDAPVTVTLYREAYIGRGLVYNTPPTLDRPGPVLSVRY